MEKLNPEKVLEMLRKNGVEVSLNEATSILEFMKRLAGIMVRSYLNGTTRGDDENNGINSNLINDYENS